MDNIYISIPSYRDTELVDTVYSLLRRAKNPERLVLSIFSQNDIHPNLEKLFEFFNINNFFYKKVHFLEGRGVGYARYITQQNLSLDFKYYLQIDSHSRFIQDWDELLINDYKKSQNFWNNEIIFSSYPIPYIYDNYGNEKIIEKNGANIVTMKKIDNDILYKPEYESREINEFGELHGHFCAGFAFGLTEYFLKIPYDKYIYFYGEEHTMSIRIFCQNIKIIAPNKSYLYHHYYGKDKRIKHWEKDVDWELYNQHSLDRIKLFFLLDDLDGYGILDKEKYQIWQDTFINSKNEEVI